jgi:hypothetical protein
MVSGELRIAAGWVIADAADDVLRVVDGEQVERARRAAAASAWAMTMRRMRLRRRDSSAHRVVAVVRHWRDRIMEAASASEVTSRTSRRHLATCSVQPSTVTVDWSARVRAASRLEEVDQQVRDDGSVVVVDDSRCSDCELLGSSIVVDVMSVTRLMVSASE